MTGRRQFDAPKAMPASRTHLGIGNPERTHAEALGRYRDAPMQAACQMDSGRRKGKADGAGTPVPFGDVPQTLNQIACTACRQVPAGAHRPKEKE